MRPRTLLPVMATGLLLAALLPPLRPIAPGSAPVVRAEEPCALPAADTSALLDAEEQAALAAINALRARAALPPLALSSALTRAARWKALDLAGGAPFSHDDGFRSWSQRLSDCGYRGTGWVSENIAAGLAGGDATIQQWSESSAHLSNMLNPDSHVIGIARRPGGVYGWYWTADFGSDADVD